MTHRNWGLEKGGGGGRGGGGCGELSFVPGIFWCFSFSAHSIIHVSLNGGNSPAPGSHISTFVGGDCFHHWAHTCRPAQYRWRWCFIVFASSKGFVQSKLYSPSAHLPLYTLFAPQNFASPMFEISPGYYSRPKKNKTNNAYAKLGVGGGGAGNKLYYGRCANGQFVIDYLHNEWKLLEDFKSYIFNTVSFLSDLNNTTRCSQAKSWTISSTSQKGKHPRISPTIHHSSNLICFRGY